ncbi:hypothetical protein AM571_PC01914 (plasmid) [Rhizobium etli 8C-3]|uniref:Uncharacterized protein n=1 Tax=Rhizobium etli 8C-3 TaxID=538025 RepID=A0A1L5PHH8_RHIET|nr:hypothetical protein [Rhizobium etli]APO79644.1 hypothetical protein AM571_PC01914 [Rhizobium etli 8C-3]
MEAIRNEPGDRAIAFFGALASQACKAAMRAKLVESGVDLGGFRGEIADFPLHLDTPRQIYLPSNVQNHGSDRFYPRALCLMQKPLFARVLMKFYT